MKVTLKMLSLAACVFSGCLVFHVQGSMDNPTTPPPSPLIMGEKDYVTVSTDWVADEDFSTKAREFEEAIKDMEKVDHVANKFNETFASASENKAYKALKEIAYVKMISICINRYILDEVCVKEFESYAEINEYVLNKLKTGLNSINNFKITSQQSTLNDVLDELFVFLSQELKAKTINFIKQVESIITSLSAIIKAVKDAGKDKVAAELLNRTKINSLDFTVENLLHYIIDNITKKLVQDSAPKVLGTILVCIVQQILCVQGLETALNLNLGGMLNQAREKTFKESVIVEVNPELKLDFRSKRPRKKQ